MGKSGQLARSMDVITGTGIDIVAVASFRRRLNDELIAELFLPDEVAYCRTQVRFWENYAARFAAKEATFKALGAGLEQGLRWHQVEVVRQPDGPVHLKLHGLAGNLAKQQQVAAYHLSMSHSSDSAIAMVIMEKIDSEIPNPG